MDENLRALLLLCAGLIFAGIITAGETGLDLPTPAERAWLAEHPVLRVDSDAHWVSLEFMDF